MRVVTVQQGSGSPNPFARSTEIRIDLPASFGHQRAQLIVRDAMGRELRRSQLALWPGPNFVHYTHSGTGGPLSISVVTERNAHASGRMIVGR